MAIETVQMKIELLYFTGCPNHEPTAARVRQVVERLGVEADIDEVEVTAEDDPAALKFLGSPTVLINGRDLDPAQRDGVRYGFSCRMFAGQGLPSETMIEQAIREAQQTDPPTSHGGSPR